MVSGQGFIFAQGALRQRTRSRQSRWRARRRAAGPVPIASLISPLVLNLLKVYEAYFITPFPVRSRGRRWFLCQTYPSCADARPRKAACVGSRKKKPPLPFSWSFVSGEARFRVRRAMIPVRVGSGADATLGAAEARRGRGSAKSPPGDSSPRRISWSRVALTLSKTRPFGGGEARGMGVQIVEDGEEEHEED